VVSRLHTHVRTKNRPASQQITSWRPARQHPISTQKRRLSGTRKIDGTASDPPKSLVPQKAPEKPQSREEVATCSWLAFFYQRCAEILYTTVTLLGFPP
jgi:hypothetical protein